MLGFLVVTIISLVTIFLFTNKDNNDKNDSNLECENYQIEIICNDEINLFIDDEPVKLQYEINNPSNVYYTIEILVSNDNIEISNNIITPKKVGESLITINVNTKYKTISKEIKIIVLQSLTNANLKILNGKKEEVNKVFVGESYFLEVETNEEIKEDYFIYTSENIEDFMIIENTNTKITFSFCVVEYETTIFNFVYKNINSKISINCYEYIKDFNVVFSNSFNSNNLNLFLYNSIFETQANYDNYYSSADIQVNVSNKNLNDFTISIDNTEIAKLEENSIIANAKGSCKLKITANDGSNYCEEYDIFVDNVNVQNVAVSFDDKEIFVGDSVKVNMTYSPIYAICDLYMICDYGFNIEENTLTALDEGNFKVFIKDKLSNYETSFIITVKEKLSYYFEIQVNQSFLIENNATFIDNILTINNNKDYIIVPLSYICVVDNNPDINIDCVVNINCDIDMNVSYIAYSNAIIFEIKGNGCIDVKLMLIENSDIYCCFSIIVM